MTEKERLVALASQASGDRNDYHCPAAPVPSCICPITDGRFWLETRKADIKVTPEDFRDLRLVWRTIESGLLALTAAFDVDANW